MNKVQLDWEDVTFGARQVCRDIKGFMEGKKTDVIKVYPIPRGGMYVALVVEGMWNWEGINDTVIQLVEDPRLAHVFVDDIIDSGSTMEEMRKKYPVAGFFALVDKREEPQAWYVFPWERMNNETGPEENVRRLLEYIGEDPSREGLLETPSRVVKSYGELFGGYKEDPASVFKVFEDGACDEMVMLKGIEFASCCEHHMLPFIGVAHIAYIPNGRVIGVSKLARLLEVFSRRLQIQERLCQQITSELDKMLQPKGSACVLEAQHLCMTCRGVKKQQSKMITSSLTGVFSQDAATRAEFFMMMKG